ncbi:MAG: EAL domain-containing protein [Clostridium sp.]|nr:EAL domain-containing protein [Clostridium sp.]
MIEGFVIVCLLLAAGLLIGIVLLGKVKNAVMPSIRFLFAAAIVTIVSYVAAVTSPNQGAATLAHGLYFAFTDWLVIALMLYAEKYTEIAPKNPFFRIVIYVAAVLDTVSMVVNTFAHHIFTAERAELFGGEEYFAVADKHLMYRVHLAIVYTLVVIVMAILIMKVKRTLKLYRRKYRMILYSFVCVLAVNIGYRFTDFSLDVSVIVYSVLAIAICYFSLFYVPKSIVVRLLSFVVRDMDGSIMCFDLEGKCVYANHMAYRLLQTEEKDGRAEMEKFFDEWLAGKQVEALEDRTWNEERLIDGEVRYFESQFKRLLDEGQNYIGCYFSMQDRTEELRKIEYERYRATHDELTGIYNKTGFYEAVREKLNQEPDRRRYMICSDIKDFKLVNSLFGLEQGDRILKRIAEILRKEALEGSVYGRLSADRFAICVYEENFREWVFNDYIKELATMVPSAVYRMHIHVGVYPITDPELEVSVMCDRAHLAVQMVKDDYQKVVVYYDDALSDAMQHERKLIGEFDAAVSEGQFTIFVQPQIARTGELLGGEALVRWNHPQRGMVPPGEFIPVFERTGFIHKLDRYVWELACAQLKRWKEQGRDDLHLSVNISPKDFYNVDIYETFTGLVEQYEIDPKNLKLEITETAIMEGLKQQLSLLERLRAYGFAIEIDDFGSGYSSLNTLKDIAVDVVKLDMGFLSETEHSDRSRTIMNAMISMSKQLGLSVVAEGVETEEQVAYLTNAGCDIFQGYYFSKPIRISEFEEKYGL